MPSVTSAAGPIYLGMDVSKNTIVVGILLPGEEVPVLDRIWNEEGSVRHLLGRFGDPAALRSVMRRDRAALSCTGCWRRWGWPAMSSRRR